MNLKKELEEYVPVNEQEEKDKEIMLRSFEDFDDVLKRDNEYLHFTSSAVVVNKNRDKVLMIYHNINRCTDEVRVLNEMTEVCSQYLQNNPDGICD